MNEAPFSANTRVVLPSGRQYQITIRTEDDGLELIEKLDEQLTKKGWKVPEWQKEDPTDSWTIACPECGQGQIKEHIVKKEGENKGRTFKACTNRSCKFFKWIT